MNKHEIAQIEKMTRKLEEEIRTLKAIRVWLKQELAMLKRRGW